MAPLPNGRPLKVVLVNDNSAGNDALVVAPIIAKFLLENKLMEGKVDCTKGLDKSLVQEVAKR